MVPCRLPCSEPLMLKACKSRNLAAGRLLAGICLYFGPLRPLFYFNSPAGPLYGLLGRLAGPDWPSCRAGLKDASGRLWGLPGAGQPLHACISDPHTDPCMGQAVRSVIQSDLTETAEFSDCMACCMLTRLGISETAACWDP
jgi:hypothetical protein